jgi:ArsR family transcriptional regulator
MHSVNFDSIELLRALGDKTRLRIMRLLVSSPKEEACLCEFSDSLQEAEYNVSRHLKVLRQSGLLEAEKEGRWVYHRLVSDKQIQPFYRFISSLGDSDGVFAHDLKLFKAEIAERGSDRCRKEAPKNSLKKAAYSR